MYIYYWYTRIGRYAYMYIYDDLSHYKKFNKKCVVICDTYKKEKH